MHIHYLSTSYLISNSANSVHVMKMCQSFSKQGHEVTLYGYKGEGNHNDIYNYYGTINNFSIHRFDEKSTGISSWLWKIKEKLPFLKVGGIPSIFFSFQYINKYLKNKSKNDVVYARNLYWLYSIPKGVSFIAETHRPPINRFEKFIEKKIFSRKDCKSVVVISEKLKNLYVSILPEIKDKIVVAHDASDDPLPPKRSVEKISTIGYVGHLYKGRGIELICRLAELFPNIDFHIVGGEDESIKKIKKEFPFPNIIFHGHQKPADLSRFFPKFDIVLAPYQSKVSVKGDVGDTSKFMSPLKIFEYMSWGIPIICSNLPVLQEVLKDNVNSFLVPPDDLQEWVNKINYIEDNPSICEKISKQARKDFLSYYTWDSRAEKLLKPMQND